MEKYLTAHQIMDATGLCKSVVYAMFKIPGFPSIRIGKRLLVSERAFHDWMQRGGTEQKGA